MTGSAWKVAADSDDRASDDGPGLPDTGGLVVLGSSDAAVCEDGFCWVPDSSSG